MSFATLRAGLVLLLLLALAISGAGIFLPIAGTTTPPLARPAGPQVPAVAPDADSLVHAATLPAPFRATRVLAAVRYDPDPTMEDAVPQKVRAISKPTLSLSGLVWGVEPAAVVEGLPGTVGPRVVRPGDEIGELKVKQVDASGVVIIGLDTTWALSVRMPWQ